MRREYLRWLNWWNIILLPVELISQVDKIGRQAFMLVKIYEYFLLGIILIVNNRDIIIFNLAGWVTLRENPH
jgi:hypothetical protein